MKPSEILSLDRRFIHRKPFIPFIIDSAKGCYIRDVYGKKYLDLLGGLYGTVNVGWQRKEVLFAMKSQMKKVNFSPEKAPSEVCSLLARRLTKMVGIKLSKCLRATSGSEAVDLAIKAARSYSKNKTIISTYNAFHGQTYGALSLMNEKSSEKYGQLLSGCVNVPFPYFYRSKMEDLVNYCLGSLEKVIKENRDAGAFILEPIQGNGAITATKEYFKGVQEICSKHSLLLIFDEVITGFGRTGKLFAHQLYKVKPDILILAKGLSSGYSPIATTMISKEISEKLGSSGNTSTFGWNPLSASGALANVNLVVKERLWKRAEKCGKYFRNATEELNLHPYVGEIRGEGLFIGIEFVIDKRFKKPNPKLAKNIMLRCLDKGIYLGVAGPYDNTIMITPPLIIKNEEMDLGIHAIQNVLGGLESNDR